MEQLDAAAGGLYALHPDAFAAARDELVKQARADKQAALARELAALRRPTLSAWLVNLLWRHQREEVERLLGLADAMAQAQARAAVAELRGLMAERRELEAALLRRGQVLAEAAGVKVTPAMAREAQDTLAAAMARPEVAAEVRTGRLVKPATYAGFGDLSMLAAMAPAAPPQRAPLGRAASGGGGSADGAARAGGWEEAVRGEATADPPRPRAPTPPGVPTPDEAATAAAERRAEQERRLVDARAAAEAAASALAEEARAAEAADAQAQALQDDVARLRRALAEAEQRLADAEAEAAAAAHGREQAEAAHRTAAAALEVVERAAAGDE